MAQIHVGNVLAKPKAIHIYDELTQQWKKNRVGYVYYNSIWIPFIQYKFYLYKDGVENVLFENKLNGGVVQKTDTSIIIAKPYGYVSNGDGVISKIPVNITEYNKLYVEWSANGQGSYNVTVRREKNSQTIATISKNNTFNKQINSVDISSLVGDFYIEAILSSIWQYETVGLNVYKIWLE